MRISGYATFQNHDWNMQTDVVVDSKKGFLVIVRPISSSPTFIVREPHHFQSFEEALRHAADIVGMDLIPTPAHKGLDELEADHARSLDAQHRPLGEVMKGEM